MDDKYTISYLVTPTSAPPMVNNPRKINMNVPAPPPKQAGLIAKPVI